MAINPIYIPPVKKSGGGLWGKIAGWLAGLAGGVAAVATGGAAAPAIPALMGAGSAIGGMAGEAISPTTMKEGKGAMNTAMQADPMAQMAMLKDSQNALTQFPMATDQMKEMYDYLEQAKQNLNARMKIGSLSNYTG